MTQKDLRDIASYFGAPCSYMFQDNKLKSHVGWPTDVTHHGALYQIPIAALANFKLHLRPIASLTDEEIKQCWLTEAPWYVEGDWYSLKRYDDAIIVVGLTLNFTGKFVRFTPSEGPKSTRPLDNYYAIGSYLQSIGVYLPGTIDEKYVQFI